jgi:hypothetical protein
MRREAKLLLEKACDSLVLSIELFNRPNDRGRISSTLILLDHAFEMLLKAAIVERGSRIREKRANETIGFDACVRRALSTEHVRFLSDEQALVLQTINRLRDAAQHHLLNASEGQLYVHIQSGVTLSRDILKVVFKQELTTHLPIRVLPVSTSPPTTLTALFESEVDEVKKLLKPGKRRQVEAMARLRPLAILDAAVQGKKGQPSDAELRSIGRKVHAGVPWTDAFKGASAIEISTDATGPSLSLRIAKKEGIPIQIVTEGTPDSSVVAIQRVNELDIFSLGAKQISEKMDISMPKLIAIIEHFGIRRMKDCYKEFKVGSQTHKRYSPKALDAIRKGLTTESIDEVWRKRHVSGSGA